MKRAVLSASAVTRGVPIALELFTEHGARRDPDWKVRLGGASGCVPPRVAWRRVGFDVADTGFVSGLSNCGWKEEETFLKRKWIRFINADGLLTNFDAALDFRAEMDERIPEHAPFFVYGIAMSYWDAATSSID